MRRTGCRVTVTACLGKHSRSSSLRLSPCAWSQSWWRSHDSRCQHCRVSSGWRCGRLVGHCPSSHVRSVGVVACSCADQARVSGHVRATTMSADPDVRLFSLSPDERNKFAAWLHSRPERAGFETGARLTVRRPGMPAEVLIVDEMTLDGPFAFTLDVHSVPRQPTVPTQRTAPTHP